MVSEFIVPLHNRPHHLLAETVALHLVDSLVSEHTIVAKHVFISSDDRLLLKFNMVVLFIVDR